MSLSSSSRLDVVPWSPRRLSRGWRDDASAGTGTGATAVIVCTCRGGPRAGVVETSTVATDCGTSASGRILGNLGLEIGLDRRAVETVMMKDQSQQRRRAVVNGCRCGNDRQQISVARIRDAAGQVSMRAWSGAWSIARADGRNGFASPGRIRLQNCDDRQIATTVTLMEWGWMVYSRQTHGDDGRWLLSMVVRLRDPRVRLPEGSSQGAERKKGKGGKNQGEPASKRATREEQGAEAAEKTFNNGENRGHCQMMRRQCRL